MQTRMSVGKKLYVSFGAGLALTYLVGICSLMNIGGLGGTLQTAVSKTATKQKLEGDIGEAFSAEIAAERGMLLYASRRDMASAEGLDQDFATAARNAKGAMDEMKPLLVRPESKKTAADIASAADQMLKLHGQIYQTAQKGDFEAALRLDAEGFTPLAIKTQKANQKLIQGQNTLLNTSLADAQESIRKGQLTTYAGLLLASLVGVGVMMTVRGINLLLRRSLQDLEEAIGEVSGASEQLAVSSQALAQGTSDQAATLEDTSASSSEINSMARRNTDNSRSTMQMMSNSQSRFEQANQSLEQMVGAMEDIADSSAKISKIIKVIDEIAFQTNILALNAAVEAARAGDAGMGFAVVADEVRNLAQRSAQAARDTADLIEDSIEKSAGGKLKVDQVTQAIHAATGESLKMKVLIDEISLGSVEQARGIDQISKAIVQLEQSTQNSAANAEEGASVAEELSAQTRTMKEVLAVLALLVEGGSADGAEAGSYAVSDQAELNAYTG